MKEHHLAGSVLCKKQIEWSAKVPTYFNQESIENLEDLVALI